MRAQTSSEYLIITAVVIIIALIVIGTLGGIPGIGSNTQSRMYYQELAGGAIGIANIVGTSTGVTFTVINNNPQQVHIHSVMVNGYRVALPGIQTPVTLAIGERRTIQLITPHPHTITIRYALSPADVIYEVSKSILLSEYNTLFDNTLLGYWSFDSVDDTTVNQRGGSAGDGELINNPSIIPGRIGKGVQLDHTLTQVMQVTTFPVLPEDAVFSISGWFNPIQGGMLHFGNTATMGIDVDFMIGDAGISVHEVVSGVGEDFTHVITPNQ